MARPKRDPLIAAMIAKLPESGEWPVDRQLAWLNLMAMAFGTVFGGDAAAYLRADKPLPAQFTPPPVKPKPVYAFYIDNDGKAKNQHGKPIKSGEVKGELYDLRGQDGDVKTILWADGSTGLNGADLTIVAV